MWMKIGFGHMGYSPDQFWSFSLREWQAAVEGYRVKVHGPGADIEPMDGDDLKSLMEKYPDGDRNAA